MCGTLWYSVLFRNRGNVWWLIGLDSCDRTPEKGHVRDHHNTLSLSLRYCCCLRREKNRVMSFGNICFSFSRNKTRGGNASGGNIWGIISSMSSAWIPTIGPKTVKTLVAPSTIPVNIFLRFLSIWPTWSQLWQLIGNKWANLPDFGGYFATRVTFTPSAGPRAPSFKIKISSA